MKRTENLSRHLLTKFLETYDLNNNATIGNLVELDQAIIKYNDAKTIQARDNILEKISADIIEHSSKTALEQLLRPSTQDLAGRLFHECVWVEFH